MKSITQRSIPVPGIIIGVCALVALLFGVMATSGAQAATNLPKSGQRLITIHDGTQDKGILTRATTLRQVFKEANIEFDERDRVEPGLDEELVANNYEANIYRARPVIVVDGAIRQKIMTPYRTPKQIAKDAAITLQDEDTATLSANSNMVSEGAGVQLSIKRATPFTFIFYGTKSTNYTQAKTVAEMLKQKNIILSKDDTLSVPLSTKVHAGMTIELWRNGIQTATTEEGIPFETEKVQSSDHPVGYRQTQTPGTPGKKTVTYEIEMKNGKEVSRKVIQSIVMREPLKQVEIVGIKASLPTGSHQDWMTAAGISPDDYGYVNYIISKESGWNPAAINPVGYYGLGQTNLNAISSACPNWQSDPVCQLKFFNGYAVSRYGNWQAAHAFKVNRGWW